MQLKRLFSKKKPPAGRWLFAFILLMFTNLPNDLAKGILSHSRGEIWFSAIMVAVYVPCLMIYATRLLWERVLSLLWMIPIAALYAADVVVGVRGDSDKAFLCGLATIVAQLPLALMKPKTFANELENSPETERSA